MWIKPSMVLAALLVILGGCAQIDAWTSSVTARKAPAVAQGVSEQADAVYINSAAAASAGNFRKVYIAPANLANMQVIQPEGASADSEWWEMIAKTESCRRR